MILEIPLNLMLLGVVLLGCLIILGYVIFTQRKSHDLENKIAGSGTPLPEYTPVTEDVIDTPYPTDIPELPVNLIEITSPDINKPFAKLSSNRIGSQTESPVESSVPEKPKRKYKKRTPKA